MAHESKEARERRLAAERQRRWRERQKEAGKIEVMIRVSRRTKQRLDRLARAHGTVNAAVKVAIDDLYQSERAAGRQ
jgi:hypothetical protein